MIRKYMWNNNDLGPNATIADEMSILYLRAYFIDIFTPGWAVTRNCWLETNRQITISNFQLIFIWSQEIYRGIELISRPWLLDAKSASN